MTQIMGQAARAWTQALAQDVHSPLCPSSRTGLSPQTRCQSFSTSLPLLDGVLKYHLPTFRLARRFQCRRNSCTRLASRAGRPNGVLETATEGSPERDALQGKGEQGAGRHELASGRSRLQSGWPAGDRDGALTRTEALLEEQLSAGVEGQACKSKEPHGQAVYSEGNQSRRQLGRYDKEEEEEGTASGAAGHVAASKQPEGLSEELSRGEDSSGASWWSKLYSRVTPRMRGLFLLNILTLLYGSNICVIKESNGVLDPATFSAGRFGVASLAFLPFLPAAIRNPRVRAAGVELGLWATVGYLAQGFGLLTTEAGRASFITTFTVIEVPIIAGLFGARIPKVTWAAAAAAVCGVGLLESAGGNSSLVGDAWTLCSALVFGVHMLRSEHHSKHLDRGDALPLISLQILVIAGFSIAWSLGLHLHDRAGFVAQLAAQDWPAVSESVQAAPWLPMIYTGLLSTAFCLWIECVSLRDVSATEAAMVYTVEPLYGAAFAWWVLGERWGPLGWFGAALILGGSLTMQLFGKEEEAAAVGDGSSSTNAAVAALAAAAAVSVVAAAAESAPGGDASVESSLILADSVDLDSIFNLLRICMLMRRPDTETERAASSSPASAEIDST